MDNINEITVYDNYKMNLLKYPRINTEKKNTDIIIIIFLMNQNFLINLDKAFSDSLKFYHDCKEYYYIFSFNKEIKKKYSAKDIITLFKNMSDYFRENNNINNQMKYLKTISKIDSILYFYIKNRDFYINLYDSLENAKNAYFERRDYSYRIIPPIDFYDIHSNIYNALELIEIYTYSNYLINKKIIKELPFPKYI